MSGLFLSNRCWLRQPFFFHLINLFVPQNSLFFILIQFNALLYQQLLCVYIYWKGENACTEGGGSLPTGSQDWRSLSVWWLNKHEKYWLHQISRSHRTHTHTHPKKKKKKLDKTITDFDPNWAFPVCNSSLNSPMDLKWCTKHSSNFKVSQAAKLTIGMQFEENY